MRGVLLAVLTAAADTCAADGTCSSGVSAAKEFWSAAKEKGMEIRLKKAQDGGMKTSEDIFYGRHIFRIPRSSLLSNETVEPVDFRLELRAFLDKLPAYNVTSIEDVHMLATCFALLAEQKNPDSRFRPWLDLVAGERLLALELTERQVKALTGTTVEGSHEEMVSKRDMVLNSAGNLTLLKKTTAEEAGWAIAVVLKHARTVHPPADEAAKRPPRMVLVPRPEVLGLELSPFSDVAITFQEEMMQYGHTSERGYFVTQIARSDMVKGSKVYVFPGHMSNSELIMRFNRSFPDTPLGIGRNVSQPPNWDPRGEAPITQEFAKYNCTGLENFELRFTPKGKPMKDYVRCFKVSWLMTNGWYSPMLERKAHELSKWPPPKKYTHEDWLAWTQADLELNRVLRDYCVVMKSQLDEQDFELMDGIAKSSDPHDKMVHLVVQGERQAFENCIKLADKIDR